MSRRRLQSLPILFFLSFLGISSVFSASIPWVGLSPATGFSAPCLLPRANYGDVVEFLIGTVDGLILNARVHLLDANVLRLYDTLQLGLTARVQRWEDASGLQELIVTDSLDAISSAGYLSIARAEGARLRVDVAVMKLLNESFFSSLRAALDPYSPFEHNFFAQIEATNLPPGQHNQFNIWANMIPAHVLVGEKTTGVDINAEDVAHIYEVKDEILKLTRPEDLVIFLGNTASYFYYAFDVIKDYRNVHIVPYSGKPYERPDSRSSTISSSKQQIYNTFILRPMFLAWKRTGRPRGGRIILVDHSRTGSGVDQFAQLLEDTENTEKESEYSLINLEYANTPYSNVRAIKKVKVIAHVVVGTSLEDLEVFDLGTVGRLIPYWGKEMWPLSKYWPSFPSPDDRWRARTVHMIRAGPEDMQAAKLERLSHGPISVTVV